MSFLRNVLSDLVEKKLWPVAVALIVALVAVPVVLGGGSSSAPPVTAAAPAADGAAIPAAVPASDVVSLQNAVTAKVHRAGKVHNPFVQRFQPKQPKGSVTGNGLSGAASTALQATKSLVAAIGGATSPAPSAPSTSAPAKGGSGSTGAKETYHVDLRFGEDGDLKAYNDVARLTPLPSSDNPFFVYLGLSSDGKSAVFLVSAQTVPTGDGTCTPSVDDCETISLKAGETEFFDLQSGTAGDVQYQLDLVRITKHKAATAAVAARAHARESRAGREFLRQELATQPQMLSRWNYSKGLGVLVEQVPASVDGAVAHLPAGVAAAADGAGTVPAPAATPQG